jgi:hypothetical protein
MEGVQGSNGLEWKSLPGAIDGSLVERHHVPSIFKDCQSGTESIDTSGTAGESDTSEKSAIALDKGQG